MTEKAPGYFQVTRSASYGFLAALPLLILYEVLILWTNGATEAPVRVGADVWIKQLIAAIGATGMFAIGVGVLAVGVIVFIRDRKRKLPLKPAYFGWMVAESLVYAVLVAGIVSRIVQALVLDVAPATAIIAPTEFGLPRMIALSIGAGLYEELVFRVLLVGGLFAVFGRLASSRRSAYVAAALLGALIFSAVHYIGVYGDPFELPSFLFRFLMGLALNVLYLVRGFGVAAWTHALYDILVVTEILG